VAARPTTKSSSPSEAARRSVACTCSRRPDFFGNRHAHISVVATTEAAEGSGVGRALLEYAEAWSRQRGYSLLTLNVFAANDRARRFYERAGLTAEMLRYVKPL
jgi:ribosomal protein S18 acetylase RimI-like enzyme